MTVSKRDLQFALENLSNHEVKGPQIALLGYLLAMNMRLENLPVKPNDGFLPKEERLVHEVGYTLTEYTTLTVEEIQEIREVALSFAVWRRAVADGSILNLFIPNHEDPMQGTTCLDKYVAPNAITLMNDFDAAENHNTQAFIKAIQYNYERILTGGE